MKKHLVISLIVVVILGIIYILAVRPTKVLAPVQHITNKISPSPTGTSATGTIPEDKDILTEIAKGLAKKYNRTPDSFILSVLQKDGAYAQGTVGFKGEMGGALWFGAKTASGWELVSDGQGPMDCRLAEKYALPTSMVPTCLDTKNGNEVLQR